MAENFPNIKKETDILVQKQRVPSEISLNRPKQRHIQLKWQKLKRRFKDSKRKTKVNYKGIPPPPPAHPGPRLLVVVSTEKLQARREWQDIFKVLKGKKICNLAYSIQQDEHLEGEIKVLRQANSKTIPNCPKGYTKSENESCSVLSFVTLWTTVHGILQARILEWVAFPFSRGSSQPRE